MDNVVLKMADKIDTLKSYLENLLENKTSALIQSRKTIDEGE